MVLMIMATPFDRELGPGVSVDLRFQLPAGGLMSSTSLRPVPAATAFLERESGPNVMADPAPGYDDFLPHDLLHFVAEAE